MMVRSRWVAAAATGLVAALTLAATPGQAAPAPTEAQRSINDILARNPGARQVDASTVLVKDGVVFRTAAAGCPAGHICIWTGESYTGLSLSFFACRFEDIGRMWGNDRLRSIQNNQSTNTRTDFYNWLNPGWGFVGYSVARNNYPTVSNAVRTTEGMQVCR